MDESRNLDFLRSVAVLCVFFAHFEDTFSKSGHSIAHQFGQLGVIIFFVHTSLVLMQSLERSSLAGGPLVRWFYIRRAFRIYPLSALATLLTIPFLYGHTGWKSLLANLSLTQNLFYTGSLWPVEWSLSLEVQMYLALPLLYLALRKRPAGWVLTLWAAAIPVGLIQMTLSPRFDVVAYSPCFLAGILAWRVGSAQQLLPAWSWPVVLSSLITLWVLAGDSHNVWHRGLFCLALGSLVPLFSEVTSNAVTAPSKLIAKYSYGIYLSHPLALSLAAKTSGITRWTILCVLAVSLPVLAFHLIEDPMIRLGKRLAGRHSRAEDCRLLLLAFDGSAGCG